MPLLRVGSPAEAAVASGCDVQQPFVLSQTILRSTELDLAATCIVDPRLSDGRLPAARDFKRSPCRWLRTDEVISTSNPLSACS